MKQFATISLFAAIAAAQSNFIELSITYDGVERQQYLSTKDWSVADASQDFLYFEGNNSLYVRDYESLEDDAMFKPWLRGGSFEFDVNVSNQDSGCVAGVYLVNTNDSQCGEVDQWGTPQCKSIDVMQANRYGFETKAHPCSNGTCDAISQCIVGMQKQGLEDYGIDSYGPGGTHINTDVEFHVKTEFLSDMDYETFWGLRTTLSQGGVEIVMQADCTDYLGSLNVPMAEGMGIVFSSWDNTDGSEQFELNQSQSEASTCDASSVSIQNFRVMSAGSSDEPKSEFLPFNMYSDQAAVDTMYVKGLDGHCLSTDNTKVILGENNRSWIHEYESDESVAAAYKHDYIASSLFVQVDLSQVECACAAGIYLVDTSEPGCNWDAIDGSVEPECSRIELMEANKFGFNTAVHSCENGFCPSAAQSRASVNPTDGSFGPGSDYSINSEEPFNVMVQFYAPYGSTADTEMYGDLSWIEISIRQDENEVKLFHTDMTELSGLSERLRSNMALVVSNFDAGTVNDISNGVCSATSTCGAYKTTFYGFEWTSDNAIDDGSEDVMVIGEVAESISDCEDPLCSACHVAWYERTPGETFNTCTDYSQYKYTNVCNKRRMRKANKCGSDDELCFWSWPPTAAEKWESDEAACRPLPGRQVEGEFKFAKRTCASHRGLCKFGCGAGSCHNSWPIDDPLKWKSADAMCRCKY